MRPLEISPKTQALVDEVLAYAHKHPMTEDYIGKLIEGKVPAPGEIAGYHCVIPYGFKCVYTVEKHPSGWYKHTSVSVQNPNEARPYPSVEGIREIIKMFGYTQQLEECMVWEEKPYRAINILAPFPDYEHV